MFLYCIFPHYIFFLWPEDGPQWPKHVVSLIDRIQRQLVFSRTPPPPTSQISFREMRLLANGKRPTDCYMLCTWSFSSLEFVTVGGLHLHAVVLWVKRTEQACLPHSVLRLFFCWLIFTMPNTYSVIYFNINLNLVVKFQTNLCCKSHRGRSVNDTFGRNHSVRAAHIFYSVICDISRNHSVRAAHILQCYLRYYTRHSVSCYITVQIVEWERKPTRCNS